MGPQRHLCGHMDKTKLARLGLPCFIRVAIVKDKLEEGVVMSGIVILEPCCEFLVRSHQGRSNVVSEEERLGVHVKQLNDIFISDNATTTRLRESFGGDDLPEVVGVIVSVPSNLLTFPNGKFNVQSELETVRQPWVLIRPSA